MARAPELGDECRPGGRCETCNDRRVECWECCALIEPDEAIPVRVGKRERPHCRDCADPKCPGCGDDVNAPGEWCLTCEPEPEFDTAEEARGER